MKKMKHEMEIRIWEKSPLIGQTVEQISKKFNVSIIKVARGPEATNPDDKLKIEAADYINFIGNENSCIKVLENSALITNSK